MDLSSNLSASATTLQRMTEKSFYGEYIFPPLPNEATMIHSVTLWHDLGRRDSFFQKKI